VLYSLGLGLWMMAVYDGLRVLRGLFSHSVFWVTAEDWGYGLWAGLTVFFFLYRQDDGTVRWYALAGCALGMLLWNRALSPRHVGFWTGLLGKIFKFFGKIVDFLKKPVKRGLKKVGK